MLSKDVVFGGLTYALMAEFEKRGSGYMENYSIRIETLDHPQGVISMAWIRGCMVQMKFLQHVGGKYILNTPTTEEGFEKLDQLFEKLSNEIFNIATT